MPPPGTDYTAVADFKLTIAATESSGTGTFDETIDVTGTAGGFTVTKAEMTLTDDETAPTDDRADDRPDFDVTVSVGGGSATSGTDYPAVENFTLTIDRVHRNRDVHADPDASPRTTRRST